MAVLDGDSVVAEADTEVAGGGRPRHATELLPAVERVVEAAGGWDRIGMIAVGVGPGAFTGLRIGVASARALAHGRGLPIAGVSSLAALAAGVEGDAEAHRLALIDAKRGEAFAALYAAGGAALWEPTVAGPGELAGRVAELGHAVVAVGDGSLRFRDQLEAAGAAIPAVDHPAHRLRARHVCRLAREVDGASPETIEPMYLRRPDAELWRERDRGRIPGG